MSVQYFSKTSPICPTGLPKKSKGKEPKSKPKSKRRIWMKICPIEGCRSKPQVKLSNHFDEKHKNLTPQQRYDYLNSAKVIPRKEGNRPVLRASRGQRTLKQFIKPPTPATSEEEDVPPPAGVGTRGFPSYPLTEPSFVTFQKFLTNVDGNL